MISVASCLKRLAARQLRRPTISPFHTGDPEYAGWALLDSAYPHTHEARDSTTALGQIHSIHVLCQGAERTSIRCDEERDDAIPQNTSGQRQ